MKQTLQFLLRLIKSAFRRKPYIRVNRIRVFVPYGEAEQLLRIGWHIDYELEDKNKDLLHVHLYRDVIVSTKTKK